MASLLKYAKCPECSAPIATQSGDGPIRDLSWAHAHEDGAPSEYGHPVKEKRDE